MLWLHRRLYTFVGRTGFLSDCLPSYLPASVPACLSACQPTGSCLFDYQNTYLPVYLLLFACLLCINLYLFVVLPLPVRHFETDQKNQTRLIPFSDVLTVKESRRIEDRMIWVKTEPERSPISLGKSTLLSSFI